MTSRKTGDLPHVECIVIDEDTLRYGGSNFRREQPKEVDREQIVKDIGKWAYASLEGCDGEEWEYFNRVLAAVDRYLGAQAGEHE